MQKLSGHTTPFAVLGHPIGHTLSPIMHNASMRALDMDAIYLAFDVHPDKLMNVLPAMADMGFGGVNLTIPLKEVAFRGLDNLDESAQISGSVNTIEFLPNGMKGHSTDGAGFITAIKESFDTDLSGLSVFILGSGGAGRAVALTCAGENVERITITDLDEQRSKLLIDEVNNLNSNISTSILPAGTAECSKAAMEADLIIQATPVGMNKEDKSLLSQDAFNEKQMAFDLVYMYPETDFMKTASSCGAKAANGLGMLLHQGARSFTIWTGKEPEINKMRQALEKEVYAV